MFAYVWNVFLITAPPSSLLFPSPSKHLLPSPSHCSYSFHSFSSFKKFGHQFGHIVLVVLMKTYLFIMLCVWCVRVCTCHDMHVEVGEQPSGVCSPLTPSHGFSRLNSGLQARGTILLAFISISYSILGKGLFQWVWFTSS